MARLFFIEVCHCMKAFFWLPRHIRVGDAVPAVLVTLHQAVTVLVRVEARGIIIGIGRRKEGHMIVAFTLAGPKEPNLSCP